MAGPMSRASAVCSCRRPGPVFTIALLLALAAPSSATAAHCAPPGTSGVSQYIETVPGPGCSRPPQNHGGSSHESALPPGTARRLTGAGPAGVAVQTFVNQTVGAPSQPGRRAVSAQLLGRGRTWPGGLIHPIVTGGTAGGLGTLLPLVLVLLLLGAVAAVLLRRLGRLGQH